MTKLTPEIEKEIHRRYKPGVYGMKRVARDLGISETTVRRVLKPPEWYERQKRLSREAKHRRTGECVDCGGQTRYSGKGSQPVSTRCPQCAARIKALSWRGTGPKNSEALRFLRENGPSRMHEIRDELGVTTVRTFNILHRLMDYGLVVRVSRGVYELS
jgi:DNA-binding MarR family transcriptional regulator